MIILILPGLMRLPHHQFCQDMQIHLAGASSHGVAGLQTRRLSSRLPSASHGNSAKANHPRIIPSTSDQTRIYEISLASAIYADALVTSTGVSVQTVGNWQK